MFSSFVFALRECLEATIVIGIILTWVVQKKATRLILPIYAGTVFGALLSMIGGVIVFQYARELPEASKTLFEGFMMLFASVLIAYFIAWLQGKKHKGMPSLHEGLANRIDALSFFLVALLTVLKEGLEIVVFTLTQISQNAQDIAIGNLLGLVVAVLLTYLLFKGSIKLNIPSVFLILGLVLVFVGAMLFGEGIVAVVPGANSYPGHLFMLLYAIPCLYFIVRNTIRDYLRTLQG